MRLVKELYNWDNWLWCNINVFENYDDAFLFYIDVCRKSIEDDFCFEMEYIGKMMDVIVSWEELDRDDDEPSVIIKRNDVSIESFDNGVDNYITLEQIDFTS